MKLAYFKQILNPQNELKDVLVNPETVSLLTPGNAGPVHGTAIFFASTNAGHPPSILVEGDLEDVSIKLTSA